MSQLPAARPQAPEATKLDGYSMSDQHGLGTRLVSPIASLGVDPCRLGQSSQRILAMRAVPGVPGTQTRRRSLAAARPWHSAVLILRTCHSPPSSTRTPGGAIVIGPGRPHAAAPSHRPSPVWPPGHLEERGNEGTMADWRLRGGGFGAPTPYPASTICSSGVALTCCRVVFGPFGHCPDAWASERGPSCPQRASQQHRARTYVRTTVRWVHAFDVGRPGLVPAAKQQRTELSSRESNARCLDNQR